MIALGALLFLFGMFLLVKHIKVAGVALSLLGLGAIAVPFLTSFYLAQSTP